MEPLTLLAGGLLLVVGWLLGRVSRKQTGSPKLMCTCGHGYGSHDGGKLCRDKVKRSANTISEWVDCACCEYDGPEPLPRMLRELGE